MNPPHDQFGHNDRASASHLAKFETLERDCKRERKALDWNRTLEGE